MNWTATCSATSVGTISEIRLDKTFQYQMIMCVIERLHRVGTLFLSDLSRHHESTKFDVPDSPTGHGEEKGFRRQHTHDGDRSPDVFDTRSHCFPEYAGKLNTRSHLTECAEKPEDTSRTPPSARRSGSNKSRTSQSTRMDQTKGSALLGVQKRHGFAVLRVRGQKLVLGKVYQAVTVRYTRIRSTAPKRMTMNDANNAALFLMG